MMECKIAVTKQVLDILKKDDIYVKLQSVHRDELDGEEGV